MLLSTIHHLLATEQPFNPENDREITHLLTDSREPLPAHLYPHTLFFALKTDRNDGARYIPELYAKGTRAFIIQSNSDYRAEIEAFFTQQSSDTTQKHPLQGAGGLIVDNVLASLQDLAAYKRSLYHCPVIAITGSHGKTVVKEWLYQLLKNDYRITRSPRSYNSQIGVPLSVWQMTEDTQLAIFEAGISEVGEMERLERIIQPTIGVITYIGNEQGESFPSLEAKRAEKLKLFAHTPTIIEEPTHQNVRTCAAVLRHLGYPEERITAMLMQQTHETVLEINLSALADNVRYFRSLLRPTTQLICMVKAFAYGAGPIEVSQHLQREHLADYLAVAVADEAAELREAGITLPIIVMDPEVPALSKIIANNAEPNIYSFSSLNDFIRAAEEEGLEGYPIHIKIDSGMHRLGFDLADIPALAERLHQTRAVRIASIFSHLAGADEPQFDPFTLQQIETFQACTDTLSATLATHSTPFRGLGGLHILNSAGIERFPSYQFDLCRLGIGMYGFSAVGAPLRNVCTLKTTLLSVKTVHAGESIGYGRHTFLHEDRQIAVIPIGYADGFDRRLGNYGGEVLVRGKRCPVVGNVCMDLAMLDVTGTDAQAGDEAIIFGDHLPIEELATRLGTITYEILTSVSRRVKRVYVQ